MPSFSFGRTSFLSSFFFPSSCAFCFDSCLLHSFFPLTTVLPSVRPSFLYSAFPSLHPSFVDVHRGVKAFKAADTDQSGYLERNEVATNTYLTEIILTVLIFLTEIVLTVMIFRIEKVFLLKLVLLKSRCRPPSSLSCLPPSFRRWKTSLSSSGSKRVTRS